MSERKLASIRRIAKLEPIVFTNANGEQETAQSIEVATLDGWSCVTKKGEFSEGDLCVYFEIDSILPKAPWSEFLADKGYRVKTIKLKGQVSQGLALPLTHIFSVYVSKSLVSVQPLQDYPNLSMNDSVIISEGIDLTGFLNIQKYEAPEPNAQLARLAKGNFPTFLKKTDEERIQNCFNKLFPLFNQPFVASEKLDGSSFTAYIKDGEFGICSRNLELKESETNAFWKLATEINLKDRMARFGRNVAIQGEMCGPGIQGNKLKLEKTELFIFNIFDIDTQAFYEYVSFQYSVQKVLELRSVPVLDVFGFLPFKEVKDVVDYVTRKSVINPNVWAEGVVFRPKKEQEVDRFGRLSFKCINPLFLLKYSE